MFNINYSKLVKNLLPDALARQAKRMAFISVPVNLVAQLYTNGKAFIDNIIIKVTYTGQVIFLEKYLNDKYDPMLRRIFIDSDLLPDNYYIYNKAEAHAPVYVYRRWNATHNFVTGNKAVDGNFVYTATANNVNKKPSLNPGQWSQTKPVRYLRRSVMFSNQNNFIVYVPVALTFDAAAMRADINQFVIAGRNYIIKTF